MRDNYLEITYRKGKPLSAYLYLSHNQNEPSIKTIKYTDGIVIDFDIKNNPIGIEITAPSLVTTSEINTILEKLHVTSIPAVELLPLKAA